ncbi:MAG: hypothetical protein ACXAEN_25915 [Candidatus Thorarchaeota archaeon]|jgi:hypothetical protein
MSFLAEERIWYDGPSEPPTTFYGFFLSYRDWDMNICPFTDEADRDYALDYPMGLNLSRPDTMHVAALVTAWAESQDEDYITEAIEIAGSSDAFDPDTFDTYIQNVYNDVWGL